MAVGSSSTGTWTSSDTSIVIVDDNGKVTGLSIGVAELIFFDDFGCNSNSFEIEILDPYCITPDMLVTSLSSNTASDGSITCSPTGGVSPYTYIWSNGGTTKTISDLSSGTYFVTVNGSRGCIGYDTAIVAFCPYNMAVISTDSILCYSICDGVISTEVTGGVEPYNYVWSTDQTSSQLIGLCVGDYAVTITDSIGCEIYKSGITIAQPNLLLVNAEANTTSAIAIPSGGTSPYSYTWSNGETTASILDLVLGYYTITVTDANGCASVETVITDIGFSIDSLFDIREEHLGAIYIRTNKNANSTFSWVGPNGFTSSQEDIVDLEDAGCYTVTMTDSNLQISKDTTICINDRTATSDIYDAKNQIFAYPNPSSGIWVLDFQEIVTSQMSLSIFDISGRLEDVVSMKVNDDGKVSVDMSRFENGVYYLKIDYDSGTDFKKIIIVK